MGTRDGSSRGIFDIYRTIEWGFLLSRRWNSKWPPGEQAGPEEEEWEGFRGLGKITLLNQSGESYFVDQMMTFKVALDGIMSWIAHPVCSEDDKPEVGSSFSWGSFKERLDSTTATGFELGESGLVFPGYRDRARGDDMPSIFSRNWVSKEWGQLQAP